MLNRLNKSIMAARLVTEKTAPPPVTNAVDGRYLPALVVISHKTRRAFFGWQALLIAILTLLAVITAYQFHPTMYVKLGGGYDMPQLDNFGDEVRPAQISSTDSELTDSRATQDNLTAGQRKFLPEAVSESYRWSKRRSIVLLPGAGAYPSRLTLRLSASPLYPGGQQVQILLNGQAFKTLDIKPGVPLNQSFDFGAERFQGGNLAVEFRLSTPNAPDRKIQDAIYQQAQLDYQQALADARKNGNAPPNPDLPDRLYKRDLDNHSDGFKLYGLWLEAQPGAGGLALPDWKVLITLALSAWLFYGLLTYSGVSRRIALAFGGALALGFGIILAIWRIELSLFATRLMLVVLVTALLLPLMDWAIPRLFRHWNLALPAWAWQSLLILFVVGMMLRGGGALYPQTVIIDQPYHIERINRVLDEPGGIARLYQSKKDSEVPAHWGTKNQTIIPYSPFTYFYLAPVAALPLDRQVSVNLFMVLLDAARILIVYALALALGFGVRTAVVAAGLYLIMPLTWLLNSWGNWPTTLSLWLAVLYLLLALIYFNKLARWPVWLSLTVLLTVVNLGYSVTMVFMGMVLYAWAVGLFFFVGRKDKTIRRRALLIFASATAAAIAATAIYYYQFVGDIAGTLTSFGDSFNAGDGLGLAPRSLPQYLLVYSDNLYLHYGIGVFMIIALLVYVSLLLPKTKLALTKADATNPHAEALSPTANPKLSIVNWLMGVWLAIFIFWGLAQWKVDMVDKHVWFTTPLLLILAALGLIYLWDKWREPTLRYASRIVISGLVSWTVYSAAALWIYRIFYKRH